MGSILVCAVAMKVCLMETQYFRPDSIAHTHHVDRRQAVADLSHAADAGEFDAVDSVRFALDGLNQVEHAAVVQLLGLDRIHISFRRDEGCRMQHVVYALHGLLDILELAEIAPDDPHSWLSLPFGEHVLVLLGGP